MGDKSLMKNIVLTVSLLTASLYANLSVDQIEKMVHKIHEKRVGFDLNILESTKNPFVVLEEEDNVTTFVIPKKVTEDVKISLHAIMGGKAYINEGWKDTNDTVLGYTLKYIGKRGVVLRNGNHIKKLFLHEDRDSFIKIE
jgi:nitrogen fixation protein